MNTTRRSPINYRLELNQTAGSTGFFSAVPQDISDLTAMIDYLRCCPTDSFMHLHLLGQVGELPAPAVMDLIEADAGGDPALRALFLEAGTIHPHLAEIKKRFNRRETRQLAGQTPLIFLRSIMRADQALHGQWAQLFDANLTRHRPLPPLKKPVYPWSSKIATLINSRRLNPLM